MQGRGARKKDTPHKGETQGEEEHVGTSLAAAIAAALTGEEGDDTDTMVMGLGGRFFE